ncbi:MAG: 6-bladed beta-propeller [Mangrovibacterium sp.]
MRSLKLILFYLFWGNSFFSLGQTKINIEKEIDNMKDSLPCSAFISEINYVPLQSGPNIMIDRNPEIVLIDQFIVVKTERDCLLFDRYSGNFIRKIGNYGKGPNEYRSTQGFINPNLKTIYFIGWNSDLLEFNFEGKFQVVIKIPDYKDDFKSPSFPTHYTFWKNEVACYFSNMTGNEKKLIVLFNKNGEKLHTIPNKNVYSDVNFSLTTKESIFYHFKQILFFKENYCDTVYEVSDGKFYPHMVFFTGKYLKPYESKWWSINKKNQMSFITPFNIIESKSFVMFKFFFHDNLFLGLYNKKNQQFKTVDVNKLKDDVNCFVPFIPEAASLSNDEECICFTDAYKVVQWFNDISRKTAKLPDDLQKLKSIKETDNPVIMIAKFRE